MVNGLSERLKNARNKLGISQREVAKQLHVSPSIISGYETGERTPSAENLLSLSFLYRCSTDYLLGKKSTKPEYILETTGLSERQIQILSELIDTMRR